MHYTSTRLNCLFKWIISLNSLRCIWTQLTHTSRGFQLLGTFWAVNSPNVLTQQTQFRCDQNKNVLLFSNRALIEYPSQVLWFLTALPGPPLPPNLTRLQLLASQLTPHTSSRTGLVPCQKVLCVMPVFPARFFFPPSCLPARDQTLHVLDLLAKPDCWITYLPSDKLIKWFDSDWLCRIWIRCFWQKTLKDRGFMPRGSQIFAQPTVLSCKSNKTCLKQLDCDKSNATPFMVCESTFQTVTTCVLV